MKTLSTGAIALALALSLPHVSGAQEVSEADLNAALEKYDGSETLATVGDQKVTLADAAMIYTTLPAEVGQVPADQLLEGITEQLISETALYEKALEEGLEDSKEMQNRLAAIRRSALAEAYLTQELEARVTEESLRARYDEMTAGFEGEKEVNARHILVKTEKEAQDIVKEIKDGADFAKLAAEKSTGPSGPNGGSLGWFAKDAMVAPFAEAAFTLKKGAVSQPVQTQFGWHVIKVEDTRTQQPPPFEAMAPQLRQQASQGVAQEIIAGVREEMKIETAEEMPPAFLVRQPQMFKD
jgi:peptidyl-prolyl cis-trans isomerase C